MTLSLKNSSPGSKADFSEKSLFGIEAIMLNRYEMKLYIYDIISII